MEDDIFAALDGDSKPFANKVDARLNGDSDKFDYYTNPEVSPSKIDAGSLKTKGKTFVINTYVKDGNVPATDMEKIVNIAKVLVGKGYVFRHTGNDKDVFAIFSAIGKSPRLYFKYFAAGWRCTGMG